MIKNYHTTSIRLEKQYYQDLLEKYGFLLLLLNDIKKLNKSTIDEAITKWRNEYWNDLQNLNKLYLVRLNNFSKQVMPSDKTVNQEQDQLADLNRNNIKMLDINTDYVRQRFTELGVLESMPNYSSVKATDFLHQITRTLEDKLGLFATMTMVSNLNTLILTNADSEGWLEAQWRTQRDSHVRHTHAVMDNKWVRLDDLTPEPAGCQVGVDYNCRCYWINFRKYGNKIGEWVYKYPMAT